MRLRLILLLVFLYSLALGQPFYKNGRLPLYNISPSEYVKQHPQNHTVIQGDDGLIYVGNNGGVLVYNGIDWIRIKNHDAKVLALGKSKEGEIFVGGENNLGYISFDSIGNQQFVSLLNEIPDSLSKFGRMNKILSNSEGIFFICEKNIFHFKDKELQFSSPEYNFLGAFVSDNKVYVNDKELGLRLFENGKFLDLEKGELTKNRNVFIVLEQRIFALNDKSIILFRIENQRVVSTSKIAFKNSIKANIKSALYFGDHFLIGTDDSGLLFFNSNLELVKEINSQNSMLQIDFIRDMKLDDKFNLWLALDKGVSVIDLNSHISYYDSEDNIRGIINDLTIYQNSVFIAGGQGLLSLGLNDNKEFSEAAQVTSECWATDVVEIENINQLIVATNSAVENFQNGKLNKLLDAYPWDVHQSLNYNRRVWVGNDNGFLSLKWNGKEFIPEFQNTKINTQIRKIATDRNGIVWLGSRNGGVYNLNEKDLDTLMINKPHFFDSTFGLPATPYVYPFLIHENIFFATTKGIYEFDELNNEFNKSNKFKSKDSLANRVILNMFELDDSKLWITCRALNSDAFQNGIYDLSTHEWHFNHFFELNTGVQFAGHFDSEKEELWIGGSEGLFRIKNINPEPLVNYKAIISQVKYDPDSMMFGGHMFEGFSNNTYNYSKKPLRFSFGANSYKRKDDLRFKYFLQGFDETWTDWNEEAEAVYTNLPAGTYNMRVKAIDFFENESEEANFVFTILPPWYLTTWAYTLYFFGFIGFVYGAIRVSTVSLQRVIKENTKEIVAQKDEIEAKNSVLENQKGRIEKQNLNILDSIRYAKRIQMATLPAEDKIQKSVENAWVMYRPKDIVSGDFYWLENYKDEKTEKTLIAAVDCTGHGVPGAFMSIIGYNGLNRVVREYRLNKPSDVLDRLNEIITTTLNQQGAQREEIKDGMDMSLCSLDRKNLKLEYAGAHNSLYIIREGTSKLSVDGDEISAIMTEKGHMLFEIKADKQPIGAFENRKNFKNHEIQLLKEDMVILFTDGYADQFGGPKGKKFFYKPFKRLLLSIADEHVEKQREIIEQTFNEWISYPDSNGDAHEQIDDICVIGVRV